MGKPMNRRVVTLLVASFFIGFPLAGLLFVWKYAHANIEKSSELVAQQMATEVLSDGSTKILEELGTLELRKSDASKQLIESEKKLGKFKSLSQLKTIRSYVGERGDTIWQMVQFEGDATFANGPSKLKMTLGRRAINKEWLVESFQLN